MQLTISRDHKMAVINKLKLIEIANRITLFQDLSPHERGMIISMPDIIQVIPAGTKFICYGEYSENFFIILSGTANVYRGNKKIAQLAGGDFVGEVGFICHETRTASVIANEQLITLRINFHNFSRLPSSLREPIKDKLIGGLVTRVERLNDKVAELDDEKSDEKSDEQSKEGPQEGQKPKKAVSGEFDIGLMSDGTKSPLPVPAEITVKNST